MKQHFSATLFYVTENDLFFLLKGSLSFYVKVLNLLHQAYLMKSLNELFNMDLNMDLYNDNHGNRQHVDVGKKMMNKISFFTIT